MPHSDIKSLVSSVLRGTISRCLSVVIVILSVDVVLRMIFDIS